MPRHVANLLLLAACALALTTTARAAEELHVGKSANHCERSKAQSGATSQYWIASPLRSSQ